MRTKPAVVASISSGVPLAFPSAGFPAADKVLQSFNTWAFKREQPSDPAHLRAMVDRAITARQPVAFVLYWGKGPRDHASQSDVDCLDYLCSMQRRIRDAYAIGARMTLVFTDTHAMHNGYRDFQIQSYFSAIDDVATARGFSSRFLSELTAGISRASVVAEASLSDDMRARLEKCAAKWFRGEGSIAHGAAEYFAMNMVERHAIETAFPDTAFITFNGSEYRDIFPSRMPIFYMYSMRRGTSVKPWFCDDAATAVAE